MALDFIHKLGCGKVIFTYRAEHRPRSFDPISIVVGHSHWPDGTELKGTDELRCRQCGAGLGPADFRDDYFEPHQD